MPKNRSSLEAKLVGGVPDSELDSTDIRLTVASDDDARVDISDYFSDEASSETGVDGVDSNSAAVRPDLLKPIRDNTVIPLSKDSLARRSKEEPSFGVVGVARTPGDMLTEVRQTRNLTIEAIADELNLRREVVEALEQDRAEAVAGATYARGYLKTYARYLNIEDDVVESWFQDPELSAEDKPSKITNTRSSVVKSNRTGGLGSVVMLLLTISVASAVWFGYKQDWFARAVANNSDSAADRVRLGPDGDRPVAVMSGAGEASTEDAAPASVEAQSEPNDATSTNSEGGSQQQPQSSKKQVVRANGSLEIDFGSNNADQAQPLSAPVSTEVVSSQSTDRNPAAQNAPQSDSSETILEPIAASDPPETVSGGFSTTTAESDADTQGYRTVATGASAGTLEATVKLSGKSDSWVEISDATGKKIFLDMVHTSEVYNVHGQPPFKLLIGNAPGIDVEYEGYWVDVMGNTNDNNVARLILGDNSG